MLAQVLEISRIEGADRIRRVVLNAGDGESVEVVCGAWNFEVGDIVPFSPIGSVLPGNFRIERRKMKGVVSNGMICSARELRLGDDHEGIMVLARPERLSTTDGPVALEPPAGVELGLPIGDYLGIGPDAVFELSIEANRPDCLCMLGIARDLAARYHLPLLTPEPVLVESPEDASEIASVEVEEPALCRRLSGRVMTGISIVPSPPWMQHRLLLAGMRPIDCVVDASNYVMLELGQPTHPYDLDELGGRGLRVRAAHPGETIVTLDGEARILGGRPPRGGDPVTALDCVICNANDIPVGIGGIMGGRASEISASTTRVLLEAAEFVPSAIGRTARHLGLRTEASARFERGVDPEGVARAADRVCELVVEAAQYAGVEPPAIARGLLDDRPLKTEPLRLSVRPPRVNALLGTKLETEEMLRLLEPIGFRQVEEESERDAKSEAASRPEQLETARVLEIPSWRPDVTAEVDVIEEVARMYGYRKITPTDRRSPFVGRLNAVQLLRRRLRRLMCGLGAHEVWTGSLVDPVEHEKIGGDDDLVRIANPMAAEESALRPGLLDGLLAAVRHNSGHRRPWIRLFEMGDVFAPAYEPDDSAGAEGPGQIGLPDERQRAAIVLAWEGDDVAAAVNTWRLLADALGISGIEIRQRAAVTTPDDDEAAGEPEPELNRDERAALVGLHPTRSALLVVGELAAGSDSSFDDGSFDEAVGMADGEMVDAAAAVTGSLTGMAPAPAGTLIGTVGEVDPDVVAALGLPHSRIGWVELDLDGLLNAPRRPRLAAPISRYPSSDLDLAFVVDEATPAWRVEETIRLAAGTSCEYIELFDVYRGPGVEEGTRSLAFRLRFSAIDHTFTEAELGDLRRLCIEAVEEALPATLRT